MTFTFTYIVVIATLQTVEMDYDRIIITDCSKVRTMKRC